MADNFNMKQFLMENKLGSYSRNTVKEEIEIKEAHTYQPGDMWSSNFDFKGMLKAGAMLNVNSDLDLMKAISDSFEDVNYHRENTHLQDAIDSKEAGDEAGVAEHLALFKNELKKTISQLKETQIFEREKIEEEMEDIVKKLTNSGRKIKDITAESGLKIMDDVINLGFKDQWMSDDVIKDAVIELLQHKTEVLRKYIGKDQLGHKMVRYNILLDDGVDQVDMVYVKKDGVPSFNEGIAAYEYEKGKEAGEKEEAKLTKEDIGGDIGDAEAEKMMDFLAEKDKVKETLSSEAYIRMDGLVDEKALASFKDSAYYVIASLREDGFDDEDILEYLTDHLEIAFN